MSLNDRTPASVAGIRFPFRNWKDITEQPYKKTARIPIKDFNLIPNDAPIPKTTRKEVRRKKPIKRKTRNREKPVTSISEIRVK